MSRKGEPLVDGVQMFIGTGPLACLSLFPVANVDKVSWD